jgi:hypothetical protein
MDILVEGRPLRTVWYRGRCYVPVPRVGQEYTIRIGNQGRWRITALVSVDGLSVMNGRPAAEEYPGYIVAPGGSIVIPGWRRDRGTVAAFRFVERQSSYAERLGWYSEIGIIRLTAIEEAPPVTRLEMERSGTLGAAARRIGAEVGSIGTGYGRTIDSGVYSVPFVRGSHRRVLTLYYDTEEALRAAGVPVDRYSRPLP